jgi:plasmid stabilization system protein ParE
MALQIEWTPQALQDFQEVILYLETNWNTEIADRFIATTDARLSLLAEQPLIGIRSEKQIEIRSILVSNYNRLYYRVEENKIVVLNIFDTRQDPSKDQY